MHTHLLIYYVIYLCLHIPNDQGHSTHPQLSNNSTMFTIKSSETMPALSTSFVSHVIYKLGCFCLPTSVFATNSYRNYPPVKGTRGCRLFKWKSPVELSRRVLSLSSQHPHTSQTLILDSAFALQYAHVLPHLHSELKSSSLIVSAREEVENRTPEAIHTNCEYAPSSLNGLSQKAHSNLGRFPAVEFGHRGNRRQKVKLVAEKKAAEKTKGDKIEYFSLCKSSLQRFEGRNQHPGTGDRRGENLMFRFRSLPCWRQRNVTVIKA